MYNVISASLNPVPVMLEVLRTGLRNQSLYTQRQLTALELVVRGARARQTAEITGTPADPLLAQQSQAVATLADTFISLARVMSDMHARSAAELLRWWETQLTALMPVEVATSVEAIVEEPVEPAPATAAAVAKKPAAARRKAAPRAAAKSTAKTTASRKRSTGDSRSR